MSVKLTRRELMIASLAGGGAWTLSWAGAQDTIAPGFSPWLRFDRRGLVILTFLSELGQGTTALLGLIAAEELSLPLTDIRVESAPVEPRFDNPVTGDQVTYGSIGFRTAYAALAPACAGARSMFQRAAAARLGVPFEELHLREGWFFHEETRQRARLLDLVDDAALQRPPESPRPKPRSEWRVLGRRQPRSDIPDKTTGRTRFGIDVALPGMLHAAVIHGPGFGARLAEVNDTPARQTRGVRQVVRLAGAVAVVADSYWVAQQACLALRPRWVPGPNADLDSEAHGAELRAAAVNGGGRDLPATLDARLQPQACDAALEAAPQRIDQLFDFPFLAHAPMEPLNATVQLRSGGADIWISTQAPTATRLAVARVLGVTPQRVVVHVMPCGGGFGRRLEVDVAIEATQIAKALGGKHPVKLIWSREVDMRSGFYRPASSVRARLALGPDGLPRALRVDMAQGRIEDHSAVAGPPDDRVPDQTARMGWLDASYGLPLMRLAFTRVDRGVPLGYWRSVGASQNAFALETLVDLAARALHVDPVAYRLRLLAGEGDRQRRVRALIDVLARRCDWGHALPSGHYRGMAISEANRAVCGHVVEVALAGPGRFRLIKIWAALDVGWVGNPDAVEAQLMGGTLFGLSAALFGEIRFANGEVQQGNFDSYRVLQAFETPPLDLTVLGNGDRPGGAGEEAVPSIAPALANALLAASGRTVARLPLPRAGWEMV